MKVKPLKITQKSAKQDGKGHFDYLQDKKNGVGECLLARPSLSDLGHFGAQSPST